MVIQIFLHNSTVAIPRQLPHLLHNRNYSKTRPLKLNSFSHYSFSIQAGFILFIIIIFLFFFWHELLNYRLQFINTIWKRKQITQKRRERSRKEYISYKKAVMAFLLGKLEQLFYLAHSFVFFLGEIQILEQQ